MSLLMNIFKPVAYISLPVFLLHNASKRSPLARYYIRLGLYVSSLGIASLWGVFASIGFTLIGRRLDTNWTVARVFYNIASRTVQITIDLEGEEHLAQQPAIMVGNHQSMLDILYLGRMFPKKAAMTAKKQLQWVPIFGQFLTVAGTVFIDRANNARAVQTVAAAGEKMKAQGTSIWIFPEGTRTNKEDVDLRPFKKGAFHLAVQAGVPVIPVVCQNYWKLYHSGTFESGKLKVKILPPIPTTGLTAADVSDLAARVREEMLTALREMHGQMPAAPRAAPPPELAASDPASLSSSEPKPELGPSPPTPLEGQIARDDKQDSTVSPAPLSIDTTSTIQTRRDGSDKGTETEEDEGMVLVGRPTDSSGSSP